MVKSYKKVLLVKYSRAFISNDYFCFNCIIKSDSEIIIIKTIIFMPNEEKLLRLFLGDNPHKSH